MVFLAPSGLATTPVANQLALQVHFREKLCKCLNNQGILSSPSASVAYTTGTPVLNGTTLFIPVLATITMVNNCRCGCPSHPDIFTENFIISFQGYTALPTSVAINTLGRIEGQVANCNKCFYDIYDSINVVVTPAA